MENDPIVETPVSAQDAPAFDEAERRLSALAQTLSQQIETLAREETARREALDSREDDLRRREMEALAADMLRSRGLPAGLASVLICEDESALESALNALEDAFRAAVQQGVEERLLSDTPKAPAVKPLNEMTDAEYYAAVCRAD